MSESKEQLIILKRVEEVAEAKKGGVWKIAHADFMTAMMAFFLIMWLVNATDEEIKKSIANYFNPMNLMAAPTDQRGIDDPKKDTAPPASGDEAGQRAGDRPMGSETPGNGGAAGGGGNVEEGNENRMDSAGVLQQTDGAAFNDPYASLASAAADIAPEDPVAVDVPQSTLGEAGQEQTADTQRDPFDPAYWQTRSRRPARSLRPGDPDTAAPPPETPVDAADRRPTEPPAGGTETAEVEAEAAEEQSLAAHGAAAPPRSAAAAAVMAEFGATGAAADPQSAEARLAAEAQDIAAEIAGDHTAVAVASGATSVLISLTDDEAFSMFAIGSAAPTPAAATLFARVAESLAARDGRIVVRGHTDARPFASGTSDNWVLSFERAHATKNALVAAGVAESRIARVEGLADREPSVAADPLADANRRIEILYEPAGETP